MSIDLHAFADDLTDEEALVIVQRLAGQSFQARFWLEELKLVAARSMLTLGVDKHLNPICRVDEWGRPIRLVGGHQSRPSQEVSDHGRI